jgi:hypothetical protein
MASVDNQVRIAKDFLTNICRGGIDSKYYADDMTAWSLWSSAKGTFSRADYLPKLKMMQQLFKSMEMKIDSTAAQPGRIALQTRSQGVLFNGAPYSNEYLFLIEFNDHDQIRHVREYFNVEKFRAGLVPAIAQWTALQKTG